MYKKVYLIKKVKISKIGYKVKNKQRRYMKEGKEGR